MKVEEYARMYEAEERLWWYAGMRAVSAALLAACVLQLRQQRQALGYQQAELHDRIKSQQAKLWDQQLRIAS